MKCTPRTATLAFHQASGKLGRSTTILVVIPFSAQVMETPNCQQYFDLDFDFDNDRFRFIRLRPGSTHEVAWGVFSTPCRQKMRGCSASAANESRNTMTYSPPAFPSSMEAQRRHVNVTRPVSVQQDSTHAATREQIDQEAQILYGPLLPQETRSSIGAGRCCEDLSGTQGRESMSTPWLDILLISSHGRLARSFP